MNLKRLTLCLISCWAINTYAESLIQPQVKTMAIFSPDEVGASGSGPVVTTNPDLSYQLLSNERGVGSELIILKAKQAGQVTSPVVAGGMIQTDATYGQNVVGSTDND